MSMRKDAHSHFLTKNQEMTRNGQMHYFTLFLGGRKK